MKIKLSLSGKILLFFFVLCTVGLSFKPREKERSEYPPAEPFRFFKLGNPLLENKDGAKPAFPIKDTGLSSQKQGISTHTSVPKQAGWIEAPSKPKESNAPKELIRTLYSSDLEEAEIGLTEGKNFDNPEDNLFKIQLDKAPAAHQKVYLTYDLYGVSDKSGVSRSINERPSRGGYQVKTNSQWTHQKEEIDPLWLQPGENRVLFSIPAEAGYGYKIKNLKIEIENQDIRSKNTPSFGGVGEDIIIESYGYTAGNTYVRGFISPNPQRGNNLSSEGGIIEINGQKVSLIENEFEALLPGTPEQLEISLSGENLQQTVTIVPEKPDHQYPLDLDIFRAQENFTKEENQNTLNLKGAELQAEGDKLLSGKKFSVQNLRTADMPALDMGMENVTAQAEGYRFLPHGEHFASPGATVKLAYDRTKIPDGYTEQDIKTYYFDLETKHWVALQRDSVDVQKQLIISKTTHFTDMINGVIKAPESPETAGFTPTMMSDIKAADPLSKVNLISPPQANNRGSAGLGYSLEMPPARNGMSPSVGIQYNSDASDGFLGEGWDLPTQSISVDTRWGVPRYSNDTETETYLMDGVQLLGGTESGTFLPHRGDKVTREADRYFLLRKEEGSFLRIQRKGSSPSSYTWQVTDQKGTVYTYGGNNGQLKGSFTDASGQTKEVISQWKLSKVEELHGDYIEYFYEPQSEAVKGGLNSQALYLKEIQAGNKGEAPHTVVKFTRGKRKQKQTSSARYGFLTSQNQLLTKVEVNFEGEKLRQYDFTYKTGAFYTDLLDKVTHKDSNGNEFSSNSFSYYNDVQAAGSYFTSGENWNTQDDGVKADFINPVSRAQQTGNFSDKATALGGSKSISTSGSVYVGIGPDDQKYTSTNNTGGLSFNYSYIEGKGLSTLVDINGDGIPDKVLVDGSNMYYRPGTRSGNFGEKIKIQGIDQFSTSYINSTSFGAKANVIGIMTGIDYQSSKTKTSRYFTDINGDGLIDLVVGNTVYFNHIVKDAQGNLIPTFTQSSGDTPSPIKGGGTIDDSDTRVDPQEQAELIANNPLQDVVRIWIAPYDGTVNITGTVQLQAPASASPVQDGVRAAVQLNAQELKSQLITANDFSAKDISVAGKVVKAGDKIYFRLQSGTQDDSNGENDQVNWNPVVTYTAAAEDPNGYTQAYSTDQGIISDAGITRVPVKNTYTLKGNFTKPATTDELILKVILGASQIVYERTFTDQQTYNGELTIPVNNTSGADKMQFLIQSSSQVAREKINWKPTINYTDVVEGITVESTLPASVKYEGIYPQVFKTGSTHTIQNKGTGTLTTQINFKTTAAAADKAATNGTYTLTVKKQTGLVYKGQLKITNGLITQGALISAPLPSGKLWVELFSDDTSMDGLKAVESISTQIKDTLNIQTTAITGVYYKTAENRFGPLHRNWGQFSYNAMEGRARMPIQENLLKFPENENEADPRTMVFIPMHPDVMTKSYWQANDAQVYISGNSMSASRLGQKDVKLDNPLAGLGSVTGASGICISGGGAVGIRQESKSTSIANMSGYMGGTLSNSLGKNEVLLSFSDMNGDGYPDIASKSQVQLTNTRGGFDGEIVKYSSYHKSEAHSFAVGIGGGAIHAAVVSAISAKIDKLEKKGNEKVKVEAAKSALEKAKNLGIIPSASLSDNWDEAIESFTDVNGDGLPDKILSNTQVRLNLGYAFSQPVNWDLDQIQKGSNTDVNLGLGYDWDASSWSAGIGLNTTKTNTDFTLTDVNSDGLADKVRISGNRVYVSLNLGNSFSPEIPWTGIDKVNETSSTGESTNGAFTQGFTLFGATKVVINPGISVGQGMNRTLSDLRDVDGDGFPDAISSDKERELQVKRSTIRRTNKLQTVKNSVGGSFTLDYARSEATYEHPGGKWVLSSVEVADGIKDDGPNTRMEYVYTQGKQDRHEREFLGFGKVEARSINTAASNEVYRKTIQQYDVSSFYTSGNLLTSTVEDAQGNKYAQTRNQYYLYNVTRFTVQHDGSEYILGLTGVCRENQASFTPLQYTQNWVYEGKPEGILTSEAWYAYHDSWHTGYEKGKLARYRYSDKGTLGENGTGGYNYETQIRYTGNYTKYLAGLPSEVTVTGSDGKTYRQVKATYDLNYGDHLTKVEQTLNSQNEKAVTDIVYDKYGNITQKTLPANAQGQRMWYKYRYDDQYHMYPVRIDDAYGYTSELENYDYRYGIPLSTKDMNGYYSETKIDNRGRITAITGPNEMELGLPYTIKFEYHPQAAVNTQGEIQQPAYAVTQHYDPRHPGNDIETISFVDGIGRALQVKKDGVLSPPSEGPGEEVMIVSGRSKLDPYGRVIESYYPVTEDPSQKLIFNKTFDNVAPARTRYDVLDRAVETILPDNSSSKAAYTLDTSARSLVTTTTDALGGKQAAYTNGSGFTVKTEQLSGPNGTITTQFVYDPIGQLLETIDTEGQKTTSVYDMAGRRTQLTHPSAGTVNLAYDALGNVLSRQTSNLAENNQKIEYEYDYTRLTKIKYPQHPENNVTYYYGNKNAKENRVGRVMLQEDATGAQEFKYGTLGEITEIRRTVLIPNQAIATYVTKMKYDSWNRIEQIIYPDEEKVDYTYNTAGLLTGVKGSKAYSYNYVSHIGYDKFEQRTYMKYCNGAETSYTYDPQRRRLSNLDVRSKNLDIMKNVYSYDAVSNVLSVQNLAPLPQSGQSSPGGQMSHTYTYDGLYRLAAASGTYTGADSKTAKYTLEMGYDNLHNITKKKQLLEQQNVMFTGGLHAGYELNYAYNGTKMNQIKEINDENYRTEVGKIEEKRKEKQAWQYDKNGNLIYVNTSLEKKDKTISDKTKERKLLWDEENRLRGIDDNGFVSNYWYDASGERVIKTSGESEQVYVNSGFAGGTTATSQFSAYINPYLVVSPGGKYTKHYYIGSQRIVSKLGDLESFGADPRRIEYAGAGLPNVSIDWKGKYQRTIQDIKDNYATFEVPYNGKDNDDYVNGQGFCCVNKQAAKVGEASPGNGNINYERMQYYYHSDHLGSSSYLTNLDGTVVQHVEYVPFGEVFIEERNNTWNTPYLFNGKELDEETGLYYYGARYFNPRETVWLSVDPLAGYNPVFEDEHYMDGLHNGGVYNSGNLNPYIYCYQNPVLLIDPNGKQTISAYITGGKGGLNQGGLYLEYDVDTNTLKASIPGQSIIINNNSVKISKNTGDVSSATNEFQRGLKIPKLAVQLTDFATDIKAEILTSTIISLKEAMSGTILEDYKEIITTKIVTKLNSMINDVKKGAADLYYSEPENRHDVRIGKKQYLFTKGYNWTVKYRNSDGTKLFLRYTDFEDKRTYQEREEDSD